jgi:hypothetical protein
MAASAVPVTLSVAGAGLQTFGKCLLGVAEEIMKSVEKIPVLGFFGLMPICAFGIAGGASYALGRGVRAVGDLFSSGLRSLFGKSN